MPPRTPPFRHQPPEDSFDPDDPNASFDLDGPTPPFPGPPPHLHRHHHGRPPPFFPPFGPFPPGPFQDQDPFAAFKDLKYFYILTILVEIPDGITGYQLQGKFNFGRGSLIRMLDELEEKQWVTIEELVLQGRAQKKYKISDAGKQYLEELKNKWAENFTQFAEMAPPEKYGRPEFFDQNKERTIARLLQYTEKEDAVDYIHRLRSKLKDMRDRLNNRLAGLEGTKKELDELLAFVENQPNFDSEKVKAWLNAKKNPDSSK